MNSNGHRAMNGFTSNNGASTSSNHFHGDFPQQHSNQSLFTSGPLQPHLQQHQHPQAMQQQLNSQNQWQQQHPNVPNVPLQPQMNPQHQVAMNQAWGNQIPIPQQFPNMNMLPMGSFNMPFISQQIIQEAFSMSAPVEASDEPTLLKKLLASRKSGQGYKDALNSLHGTNGHSASLWKDYYLDHKDRIDSWIAMCIQKEKEQSRTPVSAAPQLPFENKDVRKVSVPTIKKPSPASFKREPSPYASSSRASLTAPPGRPANKKSRKSETPLPKEQIPSGAGRRNTMNSLSAPTAVFGARLPPPNADIKIPDPPSRSPSPPTNIIPHVRGNKYTQEDRDFFIKFIGWRLKQDPNLNRHDLCDLLAEKAPHHTALSWASHWSNNHDLPDKILAAARGDDYASEEESSEEEKIPMKRRPKYKDPSTTEEEDSDSEEEEESDGDEVKPLCHYSEKEMGASGTPFNDADQYVAAKYIANFPDWDQTISKDRWDPFHAKYPHRSAKSWAEYYRRNHGSLLKLAKRIKRGNSAQTAIDTQCARPTRGLPKRKWDPEPSDDTPTKRGRQEAD